MIHLVLFASMALTLEAQGVQPSRAVNLSEPGACRRCDNPFNDHVSRSASNPTAIDNPYQLRAARDGAQAPLMGIVFPADTSRRPSAKPYVLTGAAIGAAAMVAGLLLYPGDDDGLLHPLVYTIPVASAALVGAAIGWIIHRGKYR